MSFASNITVLSWFSMGAKLEARPFIAGSYSIFLFFEKGSPLACAVPLGVVPYRSCSVCLAISSKSEACWGVVSTPWGLAYEHGKARRTGKATDGIEHSLPQCGVVPECVLNESLINFDLHRLNTILDIWGNRS
jgi:hypothetical protein